jgi:hypothetical protein
LSGSVVSAKQVSNWTLLTARMNQLTDTIFELVVEDLVNGWAAVVRIRPVIWGHVLGIFIADAEVAILIVVCRLCGTSS